MSRPGRLTRSAASARSICSRAARAPRHDGDHRQPRPRGGRAGQPRGASRSTARWHRWLTPAALLGGQRDRRPQRATRQIGYAAPITPIDHPDQRRPAQAPGRDVGRDEGASPSAPGSRPAASSPSSGPSPGPDRAHRDRLARARAPPADARSSRSSTGAPARAGARARRPASCWPRPGPPMIRARTTIKTHRLADQLGCWPRRGPPRPDRRSRTPRVGPGQLPFGRGQRDRRGQPYGDRGHLTRRPAGQALGVGQRR